MRLIDADNLLEKVEQYFDGLPIVVHHDMIEFIKNAPTVDVTDRKVGKWIYISPAEDWIMSLHQCNQCGHINEGKTAYCPNCGARMNGKETEDE